MEHQEEDNGFSPVEISSIYKSIAVEALNDFDESDELKFLEQCIDNCYDSQFKLIENHILLTDINQLNLTFAKLIHYCNNNYKYKNVSKIFIAYCDYFSLEYNQVYKVLHDKLQILIKNGFIKMIGGIQKFSKLKNKYNPENITTLFDLIGK